MTPEDTGRAYDRLAARWQRETDPCYGMAALDRALRFGTIRGRALDVGCGSTGRFLSRFAAEGFPAVGLDVSPAMVALARGRNPGAVFHVGDVSREVPEGPFAVITAWDSTFHLPLDVQGPVLSALCRLLAPGGVVLFTCGGGPPGEITGSFWGETFGYSTLGVEGYVAILTAEGCWCRHVEYDQLPENHVVIIGQRKETPAESLPEENLAKPHA